MRGVQQAGEGAVTQIQALLPCLLVLTQGPRYNASRYYGYQPRPRPKLATTNAAKKWKELNEMLPNIKEEIKDIKAISETAIHMANIACTVLRHIKEMPNFPHDLAVPQDWIDQYSEVLLAKALERVPKAAIQLCQNFTSSDGVSSLLKVDPAVKALANILATDLQEAKGTRDFQPLVRDDNPNGIVVHINEDADTLIEDGLQPIKKRILKRLTNKYDVKRRHRIRAAIQELFKRRKIDDTVTKISAVRKVRDRWAEFGGACATIAGQLLLTIHESTGKDHEEYLRRRFPPSLTKFLQGSLLRTTGAYLSKVLECIDPDVTRRLLGDNAAKALHYHEKQPPRNNVFVAKRKELLQTETINPQNAAIETVQKMELGRRLGGHG
eukprot:Protomagalhaensia_wolfi_Nauph_80__2616@NODE_275_length_2960_cov_10_585758_g205_i0_p1_GENE_NODE_275_length_2960_cov_10_585758_g205_i0NODE_275_length_2960_cov_10_585758_g205_i0_p1_ORF_typecomplete_len382_score82_16HMw1_D2/PF18254_1/0_77HMw1_D2/PF18254_1/1_7e02IF2B/PF01008_17/0_077SesA/PF17107_5/9_5e02SesA/PF17107_5/0_34TAL_FSA/PF00923_19/1_7e02TAL_FSA/PF00923_19/0_89DDE_Tnp_1_assoc/PF13808_6/2_4e03DDE_Tnp_1_assoc/PF13808_6/0_62_NODE_275_length_2960_cov_10_585758_g205_i01451290